MGKTIKVDDENHERLDALKPYDSMTFNEFIEELMDCYERVENPNAPEP